MNQSKIMSTTSVPIAVVGQSLTTYAVAAALTRLGYTCSLIYDPQKLKFEGPSLVLNDVCATLLRELFGAIAFRGQSLTYRWVRWGQGAKSEQVYQPARVIPYSALLTQIRQSEIMQSVAMIAGTETTPQQLSRDYAWTVYGSRPPDAIAKRENSAVLQGGQRVMVTAEIPHDNSTSGESCYIESLADSWLFYAPLDHNSAMLQACLPRLPTNPRRAVLDCLYYSQLIAPFVNQLAQVRYFPAAPQLQLPLYGSRCLMLGQSAVKLDPISGEGTPFALRTGILAAAVIDGILHNPTAANTLLSHYQTRLTHSFLAHLQGCSEYYQLVFGNHELWQGEIKQMIKTGRNLSSRLQQQPQSNLQYQLIGFKLQELDPPRESQTKTEKQ